MSTAAVKRVLIVAHGHPRFSKGGAELAALQMFEAFEREPGWEPWLLARHAEPGLVRPGAMLRELAERQLLLTADTDPFLFAARRLQTLTDDVADLLQRLQPAVVHFHHYVNVGIEMIRAVRTHAPRARIALTLHEFLAICHQSGQMLKTSGELCQRASPAECHACLPGRPPGDYYLRQRYIRSFFDLVDVFIAPSAFLRGRYLDWGLPAEKVQVIENGQPPRHAELPPPACPPRRFAYFGQITPFKGLELLAEAWRLLPAAWRREQGLSLAIHGDGHQRFGSAFAERIERAFAAAGEGFHHAGAYEPEGLAGRLREADAVVVPSTWWENSPLVIQEAYAHGRPVICADIGGMAEKVRDGIDGLHFSARSAESLAATLRRAVDRPGLWAQLVAGVRAPPGIAQTLAQCRAAYGLAE